MTCRPPALGPISSSPTRDSQQRSSRFSRARVSAQYDDLDTDDSEHHGLIGNAEPTHLALNVDALPPKWVDIAEQVEDILTGTKAKISALDKLHAKHVLPGFADRSAEEREIEAATTDITKGFRQCQNLIQRIGSIAEQPGQSYPPNERSRHEQLAAKNVQRGLAAKVQELSASFRKKQRVYLEKLQGHATKNQDLLVASGALSLKGSDGLSAVDDDVQATASLQSQATAHRGPDLDIRQRNHEVTEIADSIASLAELFKDLSVLVIDQGTLLDSVEYNIEQTAVQVQEASKELDVATRYQKNTGRRKCIFLLLLIIFGLVVVLIFKPRGHATSPPLAPTPSARTFAVRGRSWR